MSLKYLIDPQFIPDDGSNKIIEDFEQNTGADVVVFPDVHMKKGAMIANGMLVSSPYNIFLSCLGVENCGFTFGKIEGGTEKQLIAGFKDFSDILKERKKLKNYTVAQISNLFDEYLSIDYKKKQFLYNYLGYKHWENLLKDAHIILDNHILKVAAKSLCTLGSGNHFFEIHRIAETYDSNSYAKNDYIYMLHSDSVSVGDAIYELFSDLHEMKQIASLRGQYRAEKFRLYQIIYFKKLCKIIDGIKPDLHLIFKPQNDYQSIDVRTPLGRILMLAHNLSSIFGEMNRDAIIQTWAETQGVKQIKIGSHSHDNVTVEFHKGKVKIVHRNGVQNIGNDDYCILPSAMGDYSFIMKNAKNEDAYFSANHGTGRMQDKHIARQNFTEDMTTREIKEKRISLFRVGNGNLAEQNMHAFKDPMCIVEEMEKNNLASRAAKTYPIAVIKG